MKRYRIRWNNGGNEVEVPGHSLSDAIQTACAKHQIMESIIESVTLLGSW